MAEERSSLKDPFWINSETAGNQAGTNIPLSCTAFRYNPKKSPSASSRANLEDSAFPTADLISAFAKLD